MNTDVVMDADDARRLTDRIKVAVEGAWQLIVEAYQSRAWSALGYSTWDDYCAREFLASRLRLPREERALQIASLRDRGLSLRAISAATGSSVNTIRGDLGQVCQSDTPETATPPPAEQGVRQVTGLDGRQYAAERPERRKPRRRPLPDQWRTAVYELDRAMERLVRLSGDDRFAQYAPDLAQGSANPLQRISKQLWSIRRDLGQPSTYRVDLEDGGDQ